MELTDIITQIKDTNEALIAFGEHLEDEKIRPSLYRHYMALKDEFFTFFDNVEMMGEQLKEMQMTAEEVQEQVTDELIKSISVVANVHNAYWLNDEKNKDFPTLPMLLHNISKENKHPLSDYQVCNYVWELIALDLTKRTRGQKNLLDLLTNGTPYSRGMMLEG